MFHFQTFKSALTPTQIFQKMKKSSGSFYLSGGANASLLNQKIIMGVGQAFACSYNEFKTWLQSHWAGVEPSEYGFLLQLDYEAVYEMEPKLTKLKSDNPTVHGIWPEYLITYDLPRQTYTLMASKSQISALIHSLSPNTPTYPQSYPQFALSNFQANSTKNDFINRVHKVQGYIAAGDIFQCNLSQGFGGTVGEAGANYFELFQNLQTINPSPFGAYAEFQNRVVISNSPERLFAVDAQRNIQTRPIAGTYPIAQQASELLLNPKEQAEHLMLIDLERNDLGRVCQTGTVVVDELMTTESYSHVRHIVSNVCGRLKKSVTADQILEALFPGGTITGVPKIRCMEIIHELEQEPRKAYTGSLGMIYADGRMDLNILIRSILVDGKNLSCRFGAGIVADSHPQREYEETLHKARAIFEVLRVNHSKMNSI
jgi:anthranilate synthase component 1